MGTLVVIVRSGEGRTRSVFDRGQERRNSDSAGRLPRVGSILNGAILLGVNRYGVWTSGILLIVSGIGVWLIWLEFGYWVWISHDQDLE